MAQIVTRTTTEVAHSNSITINVHLADMEQPIIDSHISRWEFQNNNWVEVHEPRKFQVTDLVYEYDTNDSWSYFPTKGVLHLELIKGNFFLKNNRKAGTRDSGVEVSDEHIKQIPDKIHDYARQLLKEHIQKQLTKVLQTGVVIEGRSN